MHREGTRKAVCRWIDGADAHARSVAPTAPWYMALTSGEPRSETSARRALKKLVN
jgi:hypothetical protein